jgi:protein TonB
MTEVMTAPVRRSKRAILHRFVDRYRMESGLVLSAFLQAMVIFFWWTPDINFDKLDKYVEEVAFIDSVSITEEAVDSLPTDGDFDLTDVVKKEQKEDPRIAGAQDAILSGATSPIDLTPNIKPEYTAEARAGGITGTITLEIVIADTGEVIQARSVGKKLGFGLEEAAVKAFKSKKFAPSILDGKAITVKVLQPVRFTLN